VIIVTDAPHAHSTHRPPSTARPSI